MGYSGKNTGSIAGVFLEATAASMIHAGINVVGICHNFMTGHTLNVGDETDATRIFFHGWIIETLFLWKTQPSVDSLVFHNVLLHKLIVAPACCMA